MQKYHKTTWVDNSTPYINAENLNNIETGIENNNNAITALEAALENESEARATLAANTQAAISAETSARETSINTLTQRVAALETAESGEEVSVEDQIQEAVNETLNTVDSKISTATAPLTAKDEELAAAIQLTETKIEESLEKAKAYTDERTGSFTSGVIASLTDTDELREGRYLVGGSGILLATKYNDDNYRQVYTDENGIKERICKWVHNYGDLTILKDNESYLYTIENKEITLVAGHTYKASGNLTGATIRFVANEDEAASNATTLILNGVHICTDKNKAIFFDLDSSKLTIDLFGNNSIYCHQETTGERGEGDPGAIYSRNNLIIKGLGSLTIDNNTGSHGIKASDVTIKSIPNIRITSIHDAIHASNTLMIEGGRFDIVDCNDVLGTGTDGIIKVYGGEFNIQNFRDDMFDARVKGIIQGNTKITTTKNIKVNHVDILEGVTIEGVEYNKKSFADAYDTGSVKKLVSDPGGNIIDSVEIPVSDDGKYHLLETINTSYLVEGFINADIIWDGTDKNIKPTFILDNAYVAGNLKTVEKSTAEVKMKINSEGNDELLANIINGNIFASDNIEVSTGSNDPDVDSGEIKGQVLYYKDLQGSKVTLKGDYAHYCAGAVEGTDINIPESGKGNSEGTLYIKTVVCRESSGGKKGNLQFFTNQVADVIIEQLGMSNKSSDGASKRWVVNAAPGNLYIKTILSGDTYTTSIAKASDYITFTGAETFCDVVINNTESRFTGVWRTINIDNPIPELPQDATLGTMYHCVAIKLTSGIQYQWIPIE